METKVYRGTPKDGFIHLGMVIALYVSIGYYIQLVFQYINFSFPDKLSLYYENVYSSMVFAMSALIVVFPIFLGLSWYTRKDIADNPEKRELRIRKWLIALTLFASAVTIVSDLVTLIYNFLQGELTTRFVLKILVVLFVAAVVFAYYIWEVKSQDSFKSKGPFGISIALSVVLIISIILGFFIVGTPGFQRKLRFDNQRIGDVQNIQNEAIEYWRQSGKLPENLEVLAVKLNKYIAPTDPETGDAYEYSLKDALSFEVCAEFNLSSDDSKFKGEVIYSTGYYYDYSSYGKKPVSEWDHQKGKQCFEKKINPEVDKPYDIGQPMYY